MATEFLPKCPNCEHDIYSHTFSEDFQGCDEFKCGCSLNLGDYIATLESQLAERDARLKEAEAIMPLLLNGYLAETSEAHLVSREFVLERVEYARRAAAFLAGGDTDKI